MSENWQRDLTSLLSALNRGGKILICGNGGSAAEANHFAAEMVVRYKKDRPPIPCISLCADNAILTACANDYGYDQVFARQVRALGKFGDVLLLLSTSFKSANVLEAERVALEMGVLPIRAENLKHYDTAERQEQHLRWLHWLAEMLEDKLYPDL